MSKYGIIVVYANTLRARASYKFEFQPRNVNFGRVEDKVEYKRRKKI